MNTEKLWYWVEVPGEGAFIMAGCPNSADVVAIFPDTDNGLATAASIARRHNQSHVPIEQRGTTSGDVHLFGD